MIEDKFDAEHGMLVDPGKPMAILIDGSSASASEIVAAALQDNGRATVVGTRSYGKGTVQNILPLQYGRSALRLTVARYYRPSGVNIHRNEDAKDEDDWGVSPNEDALIELDADSLKKVAKRWREAAYPSLVGIEAKSGSNDEVDPNDVKAEKDAKAGNTEEQDDDGETTVATGLLIDPQLRRAVELIRERMSKQSTTENVPQAAAASIWLRSNHPVISLFRGHLLSNVA